MPAARPELGKRHTCFSCGTKFYDLNREIPSCPSCGADQREAPVVDRQKEALANAKKRKRPAKTVEEPPPKKEEEEDLDSQDGSEDLEGDDFEDEDEDDLSDFDMSEDGDDDDDL